MIAHDNAENVFLLKLLRWHSYIVFTAKRNASRFRQVALQSAIRIAICHTSESLLSPWLWVGTTKSAFPFLGTNHAYALVTINHRNKDYYDRNCFSDIVDSAANRRAPYLASQSELGILSQWTGRASSDCPASGSAPPLAIGKTEQTCAQHTIDFLTYTLWRNGLSACVSFCKPNSNRVFTVPRGAFVAAAISL